jgi:phosphatidylserine/phosphatidylglycerophosphate/cardiolipin synthase-like enzyme
MPALLIALALVQANAWFSSDTLYAKLKHRIDAATSSIDICFYNLDSTYIYSALINAHGTRGVRVRVITEDDRLDANWVWRMRAAGIPVWTDSIGPGRANLMHNKFAIFDYLDGNPANDWAWSGSVNIDVGSFNADNALEIQDSGLAHAYTLEFEQMWGGSDSLPNPGVAEFHSGKTDRLPRHRFPVGDDTFLLYFSPQNRPVDTLTRLVGQARQEVGFCIYSYTWRNMALAMLDRAQHAVWVGGVFDRGESTAAYSYFDSLRLWGMPVYIDKFMNYSNLLHEKIMVIDRRIVATGSVNWSNAGNSSNDENSLIVFSPAIAARYRGEISTRFNEAGGAYAQTDAGVYTVDAPRGAIDTSTSIVPRATVYNLGPFEANFKCFMTVLDSSYNPVYFDSTYVPALPVQNGRELDFPVWQAPHAPGKYSVRCSTWAWGDTNPVNDVVRDSGEVVIVWTRKADLPLGPRGKTAKDGAALAYAGNSDSGHVYALKGNRTNEFYRYDLRADLWEERESLPSVGRSGRNKRPGPGAALTGLGGRLFCVKGSGSNEFWDYDPARASYAWGQLPDVPGRPLRDGAGLAALLVRDTLRVYLLKGANTTEFYRYNTVSGGWETMPPALRGRSGKGFAFGSAVATPGVDIIFAVKGGTNEFCGHTVGSQGWEQWPSIPMTGQSGRVRKPGAGVGLACADSKVYLLKGGNSLDFLAYHSWGDSWVQDIDFRTGDSRTVKAGGALVYASAAHALYALKGNGTREFRIYQLPADDFGSSVKAPYEAQGSSPYISRGLSMTVAPNPFSGTTRVSYDLPVAGNVSLKLYDITGKLVSVLTSGHHSAGFFRYSLLTTHYSLAPGIYVLRLETGVGSATQKLIVE